MNKLSKGIIKYSSRGRDWRGKKLKRRHKKQGLLYNYSRKKEDKSNNRSESLNNKSKDSKGQEYKNSKNKKKFISLKLKNRRKNKKRR